MSFVVVKELKLLASKIQRFKVIGNISNYSKPATEIPGPKYYKFLGSLNDVFTVGSAEKYEIDSLN